MMPKLVEVLALVAVAAFVMLILNHFFDAQQLPAVAQLVTGG